MNTGSFAHESTRCETKPSNISDEPRFSFEVSASPHFLLDELQYCDIAAASRLSASSY